MIKTVIRTANNMVLVFDENGEEMPDFQGYYAEVKEKILQNAGYGSVFNHWFGFTLKPVTIVPTHW
jgi:hypothetical protein